jgi:hypothetical protein
MPVAEAVEGEHNNCGSGATAIAFAAGAAKPSNSAATSEAEGMAADTLTTASVHGTTCATADNKPAQGQQNTTIAAKQASFSCWPCGSTTQPDTNGNATNSNKAPHKQQEKASLRCDWLRTNVQGLGWRLDPWVLLISLGSSVVAVAAGAWQIQQQRERFDLRSATSATQVEFIFATPAANFLQAGAWAGLKLYNLSCVASLATEWQLLCNNMPTAPLAIARVLPDTVTLPFL